MTVNLALPAQLVDITDDNYENLLRNLQGNIIKPLGREFEHHVFLRFAEDADSVRAWIKTEMADRIADAHSLEQQAKQRRLNDEDGGPAVCFFLSGSGYRKLDFDPRKFDGEVFRDGMKDPNDALGDRILGVTSKDPKPATWETPYQGEIDALITVAGDDQATVASLATSIVESASGVAEELTTETGQVLRKKIPGGNPDGEPVEHFGYLDGISNPRFTSQDIAKHEAKDGPGDQWDSGAPLKLVLARDPFVDEEDAYGSFLVYRKLAQDVSLFQQRISALATSLGHDEDLVGAMVVGRFKDGTPVSKSDVNGQPSNNDFDFKFKDSQSFCPAQAHIRKSNPRGTTPLTSSKDERKRRIVRRGIPYGLPVEGVADQPVETGTLDQPRGLLFLCFQHDIEAQFEFIQRTWVDNEEFPRGLIPFTRDTGDDPLIGQVEDSVQRWPRKWGDEDAGTKRFGFESAVTLKGGEYFFAPSIPFIKSL